MRFGKIGARKMMYQWRNPYITDGLVAMRDAVWNVAGGKHDSSSALWNDIIDGTTMTVSGTWGGDYLLCDPNGSLMNASYNYGDFENISMTLVYDCSNWDTMRWMVSGYAFAGVNEYEIDLHDGAIRGKYAGANFRVYINRSVVGLDPATTETRNSVTIVKDGFAIRAYTGGTLTKEGTLPSEGEYNYTNKKFVHALNFGGISSNYTQYNYNGKLIHHRLYSRALTADEIAANYAVDKARFNLP